MGSSTKKQPTKQLGISKEQGRKKLLVVFSVIDSIVYILG
jgi:hypothetical protein